MEYVDEVTGTVSRTDIRLVNEVQKGYTYFAENDVLFAKITPCMENGKCAIARNLVNGLGFGSTEFHVLRAGPETIPEWVYYYLRQVSTRSRAEERMTGSAGQKRVPSSVLEEELFISLPPLPEQRRIAALLAKADRLRRLRRYALEVSERYLQGVFVEMFGDPVTNPKGWDFEELGELIERFEAGVNFPPISEKELCSPWRVLKVSATTWGEFDPYESKPIKPSTIFADTLIVRRGDLIMSRANTTDLVGAVALVEQEPPRVLLPDKLWRLRLSTHSKVLSHYLLWLLRQPSMRNAIGALSTGTSSSMKNISMDKAATLNIPVAPMNYQQQFAKTACILGKVCTQQREALRQAEQLFDALLHKAFCGELSGNDGEAVEALASASTGGAGEARQMRLAME
jgi:type I restriction enzyme S subunit